MSIALTLSISAGLIHLFAFFVYNWKTFKGTTVPNIATWSIWAFGTIINSTSYFVMSADLVKSILPIMSSVACILTFAICLCKGKLSKLNFGDSVALTLGIFCCLVWWYFNSAAYANLIFQVCLFISFVPTYRGVLKNPNIENAMPWFIWGFAYLLMILVIALRWQGQYQDLAYPVNCFFLHTGVGCLVYRGKTVKKD